MTVHTCAGCSTRYALDLSACPHCGSSEVEAGGAGRRLPLFVQASCSCGKSWNVRLRQVQTGLLELPDLFCASCGSQVQVPWPPVEDVMPKITRVGGPTNIRSDEPSPVVAADAPLVGAEADQGHPTSDPVVEPVFEADEAEDIEGTEAVVVDYESLTLAELKAAAEERELATYGTKAQIAERLREADAEA